MELTKAERNAVHLMYRTGTCRQNPLLLFINKKRMPCTTCIMKKVCDHYKKTDFVLFKDVAKDVILNSL